MASETEQGLRGLPSVDQLVRAPALHDAVNTHGRAMAVAAIREVLSQVRDARQPADTAQIAARTIAWLDERARASLRPVFNLTGTVLHTNLGRAPLAEEAIAAAAAAMRASVALEFDLDSGRRGERDDHLRGLLCELTGAEDATVVNNNAAAVLLTLNTLAKGKGAIVSRGELIEIGGAFRLPEIMSGAGAKLVEVGTTNRTHAKDYRSALSPKTGLILKVHTSNYRVTGFTAEVVARELAAIAAEAGVPLVHDLGSGTLVDLAGYGLPHEPTVAEAVKDGAGIVTFSGDKLLGAPQAGFIVGRKDLIARINRNPMKRALRVDKMRIAAIEATLRLYRDPDRLADRLPTLRLLARPQPEIAALAARLAPVMAAALGAAYTVAPCDCASEIGSGALPLATLPSAGLAIQPIATRGGGRALTALAAALRALPVPVIGRLADQALVLDLRCLEDEAAFAANLATLALRT